MGPELSWTLRAAPADVSCHAPTVAIAFKTCTGTNFDSDRSRQALRNGNDRGDGAGEDGVVFSQCRPTHCKKKHKQQGEKAPDVHLARVSERAHVR